MRYLIAFAVILMATSQAMACDADGDRGPCEPDTWQPTGQTYDDGDLDDGRDILDTSEPTEPALDNGRGEYPDGDR
jgi:hypothetical protein